MPSLNTKLASAPNTTDTYVLKASGTTIGNSIMYQDGGGGMNVAYQGTTGGARIRITPDTPQGYIEAYDSGGNFYKLVLATGGLSVRNGLSTVLMEVTSSGNVGIGTSSPTNRLDVIDTRVGGLIKIANLSASGYSAIEVFNSSNTQVGAMGYANASAAVTAGNMYTYSTGDITFLAGGTTERMRILSSGNIGVGTSSPNVSGQGANQRVLTVQGTAGVWGGVEVGSVGNTSAAALNGFYGFTNTTLSSGYKLVSFIGSWLDGGGVTSGADMRFHTQANGVAGGPIERMRITSTGNIGIGTNTPAQRLHIVGTGVNTQSFSLEGTGSANAYVVTKNVSKSYVTGLSTDIGPNSYIFYDATADLLRMSITSGGQVYVGGTAIQESPRFGVIGSGVWDGAAIGLSNTGAGGSAYSIFSTNNSFSQGAGNLLFYNITSPTNVLIIYGNGNYAFAGSNVSDRRLKEDIKDVNFGLNEIMALSPKSYNLKSENNLSGENETTLRKRYGFIAQEVQPILPDTITGVETETDYLGLDYNGILAIAVKAIQELKAEIDILKQQ